MATFNKKVVDVTVVIGTQNIATTDFGTPLFVATHNVFPERVRLYSDLNSVLQDGFAIGSSVYQYCQLAFNGTFRPAEIMIGRMDLDTVTIDFTDIDTTEGSKLSIYFGTNLPTLTPLVIEYTVPAAATAATITTAVKALIDAETDITDVATTALDGTTKIELTPVATPAYGISVGYGDGNYSILNNSSSTTAATLPQVLQENENFFTVSVEDHTTSSLLATANFCLTNFKVAVLSSQEADIITTATTDVASLLKQQELEALLTYAPDADKTFPEGGVAGAISSLGPETGETLHLKTMAGLVAPKLSDTEMQNAWAKNCNYLVTQFGRTFYYEGKVSNGLYFDVIRFKYWIKARSEESIFRTLFSRSNAGRSLKIRDDDLPLLRGALLDNPINVGIQAGSIATGIETLSDGSRVSLDPVVTVPSRGQIPTQDILDRIVNNVQVEVVYNSPIHFVKVRITVLLSKDSTTQGV